MITCLLQCDVVHEIGNVKKDIYDVVHEIGNVKKDIYDVARDIYCDKDTRYSIV